MNSIKKIIFSLFIISGTTAIAQVNPLASQYYVNQYITNPAYAGISEGLKINGTYRRMWDNLKGAPVTQNISADYRMNKVGLGLNINNEAAGLQNQLRARISYAYHLPLNDQDQSLHFGLSAGFTSFRLRIEDIIGNPNDVLAGRYNQRKSYLDGDFGISYTSRSLEVQVAIPNLKSAFTSDASGLSESNSFYSAVSYVFGKDAGGLQIQPKVAYRGFKYFKDVVDLGTQVSFEGQQVFLTGIYHSSKNATFGLGMDFRKQYLIFATYTTQTSALSSYTNGTFELNLRLNLFK